MRWGLVDSENSHSGTHGFTSPCYGVLELFATLDLIDSVNAFSLLFLIFISIKCRTRTCVPEACNVQVQTM